MKYLPEKESHIVRSDLHNRQEEIEVLKNVTYFYTKILGNAVKYMKRLVTMDDYYDLYRNMTLWNRNMETYVDAYADNLKTLMESIYFAKLGYIHPELIGGKSLEKTIEHFLKINNNNERVFPLTMNEVREGQLPRISRLTIGYNDGRLILVMHVPLLDPGVYHLYRLHPYPTVQIFGDNKRGAAFIHPRSDYLVVSQDHGRYTLVHENDIPLCQATPTYHICTPSYPFYETSIQPICEISLITNAKQTPYEDCDIRISKFFNPHWKQLNNQKGWLYSLPGREKVKIYCGAQTEETIELFGVGILHLRPGCKARTPYATMMGHELFDESTESVYTTTGILNITGLLPEIIKYERLREIEEIPDIPRITSPNTPGALSYDISLREIRQELEEINMHKREKEKQHKLSFGLLIGEISIAVAYFIYVLRNILIWMFWKIVYSCVYKEKYSPADIERKQPSNYALTHTDEPIYAIPSNSGVVF